MHHPDRRIFRFAFGAFLLFLTALLPAQSDLARCAAEPFRESYLQLYPELAEKRQALEAYTRRWVMDREGALSAREPVVVPVVVHVVYKNGSENISDEQILSQLDVLNADFRATNDNQEVVLPNFVPLIADTEIEFCLATRTPAGAATSGITRTLTDQDDIGLSLDVHYAEKGGQDAWNTEKYLNIWVADMGENIGGRASFPGQSPPEEDGVVIDPRFFGTTGTAAASAPYHLGRTTTHEVGHYFNLLHVWGDGSFSCTSDDEVADTPASDWSYLGMCPDEYLFSCGSLDMYTNYLYYTNDACMAQFTPGQKWRMQATLEGPRKGLTSSDGCVPVSTQSPPPPGALSLFPQPTTGLLYLEGFNSDPLSATLTLFRTDGVPLKEQQVQFPGSTQLDLSGWAPGLYFLQLKTRHWQQVWKVTVVR